MFTPPPISKEKSVDAFELGLRVRHDAVERSRAMEVLASLQPIDLVAKNLNLLTDDQPAMPQFAPQMIAESTVEDRVDIALREAGYSRVDDARSLVEGAPDGGIGQIMRELTNA